MKLSRAEWGILLGALVFYLGLTLHGAFTHTTTYDEAAHLPAGYTYLTTGDFRLNPEHPPLAKMWAAAPLLLVSPQLHLDDPAWKDARQWQLGRRFLYRWNDARKMLRLGRAAMAILGLSLVASLFVVTRRRYGATAGWLALALGVSSPDLIAHGGLVTTDLPLALFAFLTVVAFDGALGRLTWERLALVGLALGAALATKFTALGVFVVLGIQGLVAALGGAAMVNALRTRQSVVVGVKRRVLTATVALGLASGLALLVLWTSYDFRSTMTPDAGALRTWREATAADTVPPPLPLRLVARLGVLPEAYAEGLAFVWRHAAGRPSFLLGEVSERGFPHFFLVSFLVKTPLPLLLLVAVSIVLAWRRRILGASLIWLLPVVVWFALTLVRSLNIGHRHLLPIYPFLIVFVASQMASLARGRLALAGVVLWGVVGTILVHPHEIAYFNELVGGSRHGWKVLVDSSLDWGQDLDRLREEMRTRGIERVRLSYFGSADPRWHGIEGDLLPSIMSPRPRHVSRRIEPGDHVAVSATNLQGVYLDAEDRALMARLRREEPLARVGRSIFLFRVPFRWEGTEAVVPTEERE